MRNCLRIPRVFLPRKGFRKWAAPACGLHASNGEFWKRVAHDIGDAPSALSCIFPDFYIGNEDEARREELRESIYSHLERGVIERLNRGFILVSRQTSAGLRRGILALVDLDEYSIEAEKDCMVRAAQEVLPAVVKSRAEARKGTVLEFPHAVLFYRDKRDKIMRSLEDEELERVYEFEPVWNKGGKVTGEYIPDYIAEDVLHDLLSKADPCFGVADGNHGLAAAKLFWDDLRTKISAGEQRNHPARFALVEFVNICDDAVAFEPVHRRLTEIDTEAFCEFFAGKVKCKRTGNVLYPAVSGGVEGYRKIDSAIAEYLNANEGVLQYVSSAKTEEGVLIAIPAVDKDEVLAALKAGKRFPCKTFTLGKEEDARYCVEGKEISYD